MARFLKILSKRSFPKNFLAYRFIIILSLNLIPHTAERTNIGTWQVGSKVNLEVDVLARYIERLLLGDKAAEQKTESNISMAFLAENGFLK